MAKKKRTDSVTVALVVLGTLLAAVVATPREVWAVIGVGLVIWLVVRHQAKAKGPSATPQPEPPRRRGRRALEFVDEPSAQAARQTVTRSAGLAAQAVDDELVDLTPAPGPQAGRTFGVPRAPRALGPGRWIPAGEPIEVAGTRIDGGMVYLGTSLKTPSGDNDPALIDPRKPVAATGDCSERQFGYWPSYAEIPASARRAYLDWLAGGRADPRADIGYVFLFFYGLERRALLDAVADPAVKAEWPLIAAELRRLLAIYGRRSGSFHGYASNLLNIVQLSDTSGNLYEKPLPDLQRSYELPLYLKMVLGQCAAQGVPVPANVALAWLRLSPDIYLRTPATRCPDEFAQLFATHYARAHGAGMLLPKNRTRLRLVYNAASAGFRGHGEVSLTVGDLPDVSVLTAPLTRLRAVADVATAELDGYSRYLGRNPAAKGSAEALLQLPVALWPPAAQAVLQGLKGRMGTGMLTLTFQDLLGTLDARTSFNKDKVQALARALESVDVGVEPDVLGGAKVPKPEDMLVLFHLPPGVPASRDTPAYQAARLTLQLSAAVAAADGDFGAAEIGHLRRSIESWTHLTPNHRQRLLAHMRLLLKAPVTLASLKKKLEPLDLPAREAIAAFMATVAQADGDVNPTEVKALEKVYKVLGVEPQKVFADVNSVAAGARPAQRPKQRPAGFTLDADRIAALQQDSQKVSALLSGIFQEDEVAEPRALAPEVDAMADAAPQAEGLMGLDEAHTALARLVITRQSWPRADLEDAAADLDLMLEAALATLNEAAFDRFDIPFTEGDDPVEVNHDVLEKVAA